LRRLPAAAACCGCGCGGEGGSGSIGLPGSRQHRCHNSQPCWQRSIHIMRLCKNRFQDYEGEDEFRETLLDEYKAAQEDVDFVATLIIATSETSSYEDVSLFVFLGTDGKLYEVHGSHCSCYGFEEQWQPEETT